MKYILFLPLALFFLQSCSSKPTVTIEMQNATRSDWILLSVRDSSVVVLPTYEELGKGLAFTHAIVIPSRSISRLVVHPSTTFLERLPLAFFGMGVGWALKACSCNDKIYHIVLAGVIGYNLSVIRLFFQGDDAYFLWLAHDREKLRKESVFPVEPEIMQYVH